MVAENWPLIRLVAQYLSQRRTLNREEFLSILEAHQSQQFIEIAATRAFPITPSFTGCGRGPRTAPPLHPAAWV